jgi:SAM-dependent methyltransferase
VIEIGAGEGAILQRLSDIGFAEKLYALEISPTGVQAIRDREIPGLEECSLFDGYTVPYDDQTFGLAVLSHVLEHVEYPRRLVYEAKRIARFVFVEVPLEDTWRLARDFVRDEVGHINPYSPKTIRRLLQTCDLEILDQVIANRSLASYTYQTGKKGLVSYYIKEALLRVLPFLATQLFTYHAAFICQDVQASL